MSRGTCSTCGMELTRPANGCQCGSDFDPDDLHVTSSTGAVGALWSAVHALEDKASSGRWRSKQPKPPPHLEETIDRADEEAGAIREVLKKRDGDAPSSHPTSPRI